VVDFAIPHQEGGMLPINDFITVYESSDGGSGNAAETTWQFFVGDTPVSTKNPFFADTARLAIQTNTKVTFTVVKGQLSQLRLQLKTPAKSKGIRKPR
jgi:hypothetical protein